MSSLRWPTLQQRPRPVSSISLTVGSSIFLVLFSSGPSGTLAQSPASPTLPAQTSATDPAAIFREGQLALEKKQYKRAEEAFRTVIHLDPRSFAAYANLGVVYIREKKWD